MPDIEDLKLAQGSAKEVAHDKNTLISIDN